MTAHIILTGFLQRNTAKQAIDDAPDGARVYITEKAEARTQAQNRCLHLWYGQIAKHFGDRDAHEVKGECHCRFALDILLRDDPQFAYIWKRSGAGLSYERQCKLLASGVFNVSSGMSVKQLSEYMDAMSRHYRAEGVYLTDPEARKYEEENAQ